MSENTTPEVKKEPMVSKRTKNLLIITGVLVVVAIVVVAIL